MFIYEYIYIYIYIYMYIYIYFHTTYCISHLEKEKDKQEFAARDIIQCQIISMCLTYRSISVHCIKLSCENHHTCRDNMFRYASLHPCGNSFMQHNAGILKCDKYVSLEQLYPLQLSVRSILGCMAVSPGCKAIHADITINTEFELYLALGKSIFEDFIHPVTVTCHKNVLKDKYEQTKEKRRGYICYNIT